MENDLEYGNAVNHLCLHECNLDNVDLFNSQLIKSPMDPQGIDMGLSENLEAITIVSIDLLRYAITVLCIM